MRGEFDAIVSESLLAEVVRALARPKLASRVAPDDAAALLELLRKIANAVPNPSGAAPVSSTDPADDYLLALAYREDVPLVSGDRHLLDLSDRAPVLSPRNFLDRLSSR